MAKPRVVVLRAPGINCEEETRRAWMTAGADCDIVHLDRIREQPGALDRYAILTVPGGFSFGDDISAGRIFARRMMRDLGGRLGDFLERDRMLLGICNGFQILMEAGLLDGGKAGGCALAANRVGHYLCRWVTLESGGTHCLMLEKNRKYFLPIAHAEGRFAISDPPAIDRARVALRYTDGVRRRGPVNPNGSFDHVAALTDATGRVLGMMPHPERFVDGTQHPFWTALGSPPDPDGLAIFRTAVRQFC